MRESQIACPTGKPLPSASHRHLRNRSGAVLIWVALMLLVLLGLVGLVIDAGVLMAAHRHAQNAADAAAMAAATDLLRVGSKEVAIATGTKFVETINEKNPDLAGPPSGVQEATVNIPPLAGNYQGASDYVEVIVTRQIRTFFIHVLDLIPGVNMTASQTVTARAVAGFESVAAGEGVFALNPDAVPGIEVKGGARLIVEGRVVDNSTGGGYDENGLEPLDETGEPLSTESGYSAKVTNNSTLVAVEIQLAGGVNDLDNFQNYYPDGSSDFLQAYAGQEADPLRYLITPSVDTGVDPAERGAPKATDGGLQLNNSADDSDYPNRIVDDPELGEVLELHPGIYESITITGGNVRLVPGIYVLRPNGTTPYILTITGGNVVADEVMFYNTGSDYTPDGLPDSNDENTDVPPQGVEFGDVKINAGMQFSPMSDPPIDYDYLDLGFDFKYQPPEGGMPISEDFHGMLFYQRRWSDADFQIQGNSESGDLTGTLYAKRGDVKISGQGTYDAQFVVGSLTVTGQGDVTVNYTGDNLGRAPRVFLVE